MIFWLISEISCASLLQLAATGLSTKRHAKRSLIPLCFQDED
jgi:hypothetical protein